MEGTVLCLNVQKLSRIQNVDIPATLPAILKELGVDSNFATVLRSDECELN